MKRITTLFLLCMLLVPALALAQRAKDDPRQMKKFDASTVPTITDWNTYSKALKPDGLLRSAVPASKAVIEKHQPVTKGTFPSVKKQSNTHGMWKVMRSANGTVNWMWLARPKKSDDVMSVQSIAPNEAMKFLQSYSHVLKLEDPKSELRQMSEELSQSGRRHVRFAQQYKGVPIWNRDLYVHIDNDGVVSTVNGTYEPTPVHAVTSPKISSSLAIESAINDLKSRNRWAPIAADAAEILGYHEPEATLVLYPSEKNMTLAYSVEVHANLTEEYEYLIDASTGSVIRKISKFCSLVPVDENSAPITLSSGFGASKESSKNARPLAGSFTNASGVDLNGVTQNFRVYQNDDGLYYSIWDLASFDAANSQLPNTIKGGGVTLTLNNNDYSTSAQMFHVTSNSTTFSDKAGINAHHNMKTSYDYFVNAHGRKAIDNQNGLMISIVHATENGQGMDNAYWTGQVMIYGDGNQQFKPLAGGLDVGGHEMSHGVIGNSANLVYENQPGALNESFADVFGVMIDPRNLLQGEDVVKPGLGTCLRDLENPANPQALSQQPAHMDQFQNLDISQDNGGVHINSGIPNRAAALIINALGREKAGKIYYNALTKYLTRNSQFIDCRHACEQAAKDLGLTTEEQNTVSNSFAAVGIGEGTSNTGGNDVPQQTGGTSLIAVIDATGRVGLVDPATGQFQMYGTTPDGSARISQGFRAQVTTGRSGQSIWFVNQLGQMAYIVTQTGEVFSFPNLNLGQAGDLWNCSVSPDMSYAAITSAYENDPFIYIFDGQNVAKLPLLVETGDGSGLPTIKYPDVINWSPNAAQRRVALDAYNEVNIAGSLYAYWGIYEFNFNSQRTYDLIPTQPFGIDVGNIKYSNLDPDAVVFNTIQEGIMDASVADFNEGVVYDLTLYALSIGGSPVFDGEKPSFNPTDDVIVVSTPSNNALLFVNAKGDADYWQYNFPFFNPHWFLIGGQANVGQTSPAASFDVTVYPTIMSEKATITISASEPVQLVTEVLNVMGQCVTTLAEGKYTTGEHTLSVDGKNLASGTYFIRVSGGDGIDVLRKIVKE